MIYPAALIELSDKPATPERPAQAYRNGLENVLRAAARKYREEHEPPVGVRLWVDGEVYEPAIRKEGSSL